MAMIPFSYKDFVFMYDESGDFTLIDCSKYSYILWHHVEDWQIEDKNEQITVFVFQYKILSDVACNVLAFTEKENFKNRFNESFDFRKICILPSFPTFTKAQDYLTSLGYKKENVFDESGDDFRFYSELGMVS